MATASRLVGTIALAAAVMPGGCSSAETDVADASTRDASRDVGRERAGDVAVDVRHREGEAGPALLTELALTEAQGTDGPRATLLVPTFSPYVHDYYVRCAAGKNELTLSMTASFGSDSVLVQPIGSPRLPKQTITPVTVRENEAIVAEATGPLGSVEYWVRCLPHDFPAIQVEAPADARTPSPGYYLLGNFDAATMIGAYAMVLDGRGVPVWYFHEPSGGVSDVDGVVPGAVSFIPLFATQLEVHTIRPMSIQSTAPAGMPLDFHELQVLPNGHYLVTSNPKVSGVDLTGLFIPDGSDGGVMPLGPDSTIADCELVEFDPKTGAIVWTWDALAHFDPAKDCTEPLFLVHTDGGPLTIDTYHCNSIDIEPMTGNLLVSARHMDSVFYVERSSGRVLWKMGGSTASLDGATYVPVDSRFLGQHDARLQPGWSDCNGGQVSLFDDETFATGEAKARAVVYDVALGGRVVGCPGGPGDAGSVDGSVADGGAPSARLVWERKGGVIAGAGGSFRVSSDGSRVVGWGLSGEVLLSEVDVSGSTLFEIRSAAQKMVIPMNSYRSIKVPLADLDLPAMRATAGLP